MLDSAHERLGQIMIEIIEAAFDFIISWRIFLSIAIAALAAHFLGLFESNGIFEESVLLFIGFLVGLIWESQANRDPKT